jgi:hypothetical protein
MQKCRMKSSTEETKFRNPASTFAFASSGERAHLPRERLHADEDVLHRSQGLRIQQEHITIGFSPGLHPGLKTFVGGTKAIAGRHVSALSAA